MRSTMVALAVLLAAIQMTGAAMAMPTAFKNNRPHPTEVQQLHRNEDMSSAVVLPQDMSVVGLGSSYDFPRVVQFQATSCMLGVRPSLWKEQFDIAQMADKIARGNIQNRLIGAVGAMAYDTGRRQVVLLGFDETLSGSVDGMVGEMQDKWRQPEPRSMNNMPPEMITQIFMRRTATVGYYWVENGKEVLVACMGRKLSIGDAMMFWDDMVGRIVVQ